MFSIRLNPEQRQLLTEIILAELFEHLKMYVIADDKHAWADKTNTLRAMLTKLDGQPRETFRLPALQADPSNCAFCD